MSLERDHCCRVWHTSFHPHLSSLASDDGGCVRLNGWVVTIFKVWTPCESRSFFWGGSTELSSSRLEPRSSFLSNLPSWVKCFRLKSEGRCMNRWLLRLPPHRRHGHHVPISHLQQLLQLLCLIVSHGCRSNPNTRYQHVPGPAPGQNKDAHTGSFSLGREKRTYYFLRKRMRILGVNIVVC